MSRVVSFIAAASVATAQYTCKSDKSFGTLVAPSKKGLAVDDNTFKWCPKQVPVEWPNGEGTMTSLRLFRAWDSTWEGEKEGAFDAVAKHAWDYDAKILLGTPISCDEGEDMKNWEWTKELLSKLGPQHVMGLAIGNELELLHMKGAEHVTAGCLDRIWGQGYLWNKFRQIVSEFDSLGFSSVPVTSVFTGLGLAGNPFYEIPHGRVNTFLTNMTKLYGDRFVFTFNFYPYFDPSQRLDQGTSDQCAQALKRASCLGEDCAVSIQLREARMKMRTLLGGKDGTLWIGETGWSSPVSSSLTTAVKACPAWSSLATMERFYRGFFEWDLSIGGGEKGPDHVFWFTMRDSSNFGKPESFGLISTCDDPACKIKSASFQAAKYTLFMGPATSQCADDHFFNGWVHGGNVGGDTACRNKCTITPGCWFYGTWPDSNNNEYWCRLTSSCDKQASTDGHLVTTYRIESSGPATSQHNTESGPLSEETGGDEISPPGDETGGNEGSPPSEETGGDQSSPLGEETTENEGGPPGEETGGDQSSPPLEETGGDQSSPPREETGGDQSSPPLEETGGDESSPLGEETGGDESSPLSQETGGDEGSPLGEETGGNEGSPPGEETGGDESSPLVAEMASASRQYLTFLFFLQIVTCVAGLR